MDYMQENVLLEDLEIYKLALEVGESTWNIVDKWDYFAKRTVGAQFVEAADSIAANIAEGYGRFFYKDRKQFCYYSRGSLMETRNWIAKASNRNLIATEEANVLTDKLKVLHFKLNTYIKKLKQNVGADNK